MCGWRHLVGIDGSTILNTYGFELLRNGHALGITVSYSLSLAAERFTTCGTEARGNWRPRTTVVTYDHIPPNPNLIPNRLITTHRQSDVHTLSILREAVLFAAYYGIISPLV